MLGSLAWRGCSGRGFWVGLGKTGGKRGEREGFLGVVGSKFSPTGGRQLLCVLECLASMATLPLVMEARSGLIDFR